MIYLGGGGSEHDESRVWDAAFHPGQRIVVWPQAQPAHRWAGTLSWVQTALTARGSSPDAVTLGTEALGPDHGLATADALVIPGGNTFTLLAHLRQHDLLPRVRAFLSRGGVVYGGSAGAVIMGRDVGVVEGPAEEGLDENREGMGRDFLDALDALGGCVVFPHYDGGARWERHCGSWARERGVTVLGIPERGGLVVDVDVDEREAGGWAESVGPEEVRIFGRDGSVRMWPDGVRMGLRELGAEEGK